MPKKGHYNFSLHPDAKARMRSAVRLVKLLLQPDIEVLPEHRHESLTICLWKLTEAEGNHKHRTRFCSEAAYHSPNGELRHDHVYQRASMIRELLSCGSEDVEAILGKAVACTITKEEHTRLNAYSKYDGWERYRLAGITVIDLTNTE